MTLNREFTSIVRPNVLILRAAKVPASHYEETIAGTLTHPCADPGTSFGSDQTSVHRGAEAISRFGDALLGSDVVARRQRSKGCGASTTAHDLADETLVAALGVGRCLSGARARPDP
jgi:hypothetical protein